VPVDIDQAAAQLNIAVPDDPSPELTELELYVDAANEWMAEKVYVDDLGAAPVILATLFLIGHLWESQRGPASTPLNADEVVFVSRTGFAIPNYVLELIQPYLMASALTGGGPAFSFPDAYAFPDAVEYPAP
jgi:hypothetical protein